MNEKTQFNQRAQVGDELPKIDFKTLINGKVETICSEDLFKNKKVLVIGVIGAFMPTCTQRHLPEYIPYAEELIDNQLVDQVVCVSVADPFVLDAWLKSLNGKKITMLTDTSANFAKTIGVDINLDEFGLGTRSTRYAMLIKNNIIDMLKVELNPKDVELTSKDSIADYLLSTGKT